MEGIKKLLSAQTAGLPNWAWLLIIGGGVALAIVVPKYFKGFGGTSDTTSTDTGTTATPTTDMSGYTPYGGGYGGGSGTTGTTDGGTPTTPTDGTNTPTPVPPTVGGTTPPPPPFPPVQPSPPPPPPSTAPPDQCKERQKCIDYHIAHTCKPIKDEKKRAECEQHWILKCNNTHPCGHSLVPSVHETTHLWPHNRQPRRHTVAMDNAIEEGMTDGNIE